MTSNRGKYVWPKAWGWLIFNNASATRDVGEDPLKDLLGWFYWGLPAIFACLLVTKAEFGFGGDGDRAVWHIGTLLAVVTAVLMCRRILKANSAKNKWQYGKACVALILTPMMVEIMGFTMALNNSKGLGSSLFEIYF